MIVTWIEEMKDALSSPWVVAGLLAQTLFFSRWIIQWIVSEKEKRSYIPIVFWYISLLGGLILLVYAIHRRDPVFVIGQLVGCLNYSRNIMLIKKHKPANA